MTRTWTRLAGLGATALLVACADVGSSGSESIDPFASLISQVPSCGGVPATIYQTSEGEWVRPAGASVFPLAGGGFRINGTAGDDVIVGSAGNDVILPGLGNDIVCAGAGNDLIEDAGGDDRLWGEDGDDRIIAGPGNDRADGGRGSDLLIGGAGVDELLGGPGADRLYGDRPGRPFQPKDAALGGPGVDTCSADIVVDCEIAG